MRVPSLIDLDQQGQGDVTPFSAPANDWEDFNSGGLRVSLLFELLFP